MKFAVIGAGIGGLAISCLLAHDGHTVDVFEKNAEAGGKMSERIIDGFRFDTGPSLFTLPAVLEELFENCGHNIDDYLDIVPLEPLCRYFYPNGTVFDCYSDLPKTLDEIKKFAPDDRQAYTDFLFYSADLYRRTAPAFLFNPLNNWKDVTGLNLLDLSRIDALNTVSSKVDEMVKSPELRQFFKRFATYNGSSPFKAPATLNVIPHIELTLGGYYVKGGLYRIAETLLKMAGELDVRLHFETEVVQISVQNGKAEGVQLKGNGEIKPYDGVISNSDATETYSRLLDDHSLSERKRTKIRKSEPSSSGFVILAGIDRKYPQIGHHNIFFGMDYEKEFQQVFDEHRLPDDPTIYLSNTSFSDPDHAPDRGSNYFILINAPFNDGSINWDKKKGPYAHHILARLEAHGLDGLSKAIKVLEITTPEDFEKRYRSYKGAIYGTSSNNRLAAFARPRNKSPYVNGLYLVGGSTHPGGGIPLVLLSARHAYKMIRRDYK